LHFPKKKIKTIKKSAFHKISLKKSLKDKKKGGGAPNPTVAVVQWRAMKDCHSISVLKILCW